MANQNVFTHLTNVGQVSRLINFNENIIATQAALIAQTFPATAADGQPTNITYTAIDTKKTWRWLGGQTNTDATSAGNGTSWFDAAKEESEIVVITAAPPIDSWEEDTLITGAAPTGLTAATNQLVWQDATGKVHLYSVVDPMGTPVYTEITTNELMRVDNTTLTDAASVLALSPLRFHTIYFNSTTGQEWLVDENGEVSVLTTKRNYGEVEWNNVALVAATPYTFDLNLDASITIQDGDVAKPTTNEFAMTANTLLHGVEILDVDNGLPLNTNNYRVTPLTTSTFQIETNVDCNVKAIFGGLLGK